MSHQLKADFSTRLQPSNASKGSVHAGTVTLACSQLPKDSTKSHCVARMSRFSTERSYFLRSHWETGSCLFPPTIPINRKGPWLERKRVLLFCRPHGIHAAKRLTFRKTAPVKVLAVLHVSSTVCVLELPRAKYLSLPLPNISLLANPFIYDWRQ